MKQSGFLLPVVFIFLFILTLWGLTALAAAQLQMRMSINWNESAQQLAIAEIGLQQGEQALQDLSMISCFYATSMLYGVNQYPWLTVPACSVVGLPLATHYVIEQLPGMACVLTAAHQQMQAHFYRITAWSQIASGLGAIVQSIYLKESDQRCISAKHGVLFMSGRLSWRQLN